MESLKQELLERYENTGRVGFAKPQSIEEAYSLIDTICELYNNEQNKQIAEDLNTLENVNEQEIEEVISDTVSIDNILKPVYNYKAGSKEK